MLTFFKFKNYVCLYVFLFFDCLFLFSYIQVPPQIQPFSFSDEPSNTGEMAAVFCLVPKGDLPLEIRWTLNSAPIISGEHGFSLSRMNARTSSLNIESLGGIHRGVYKCIAKNKAGTNEFSAELHVNGL